MKAKLEQEISLSEISLALKELKSYKCPGVDGISVAFYKVFYGKLKFFLRDLINEIVENGKLHLSARRGIITLIEKIGKDPLLVDNWRPICLLCTDYKIFAKIIALRLQGALPHIINTSQTGFMKGCNIGENILKLESLINYCESTKTSAVMISFDFYKAFDSVE